MAEAPTTDWKDRTLGFCRARSQRIAMGILGIKTPQTPYKVINPIGFRVLGVWGIHTYIYIYIHTYIYIYIDR